MDENALHGDSRLHFEIKNVAPVSADDYGASIQALSDEYSRYLMAFESRADAVSTKLYVGKVKSGSIINELLPIAVGVLPLLDAASTVIDYSNYLKAIIDWTLGKLPDKPAIADEKKTLKNVVRLIEPTAKDQGAQMNIGVLNVSGGLTVNVSLGAMEANASQNFLRRYLNEAPEPSSRDRQSVVLYWYQTRNALNNKTGDKARIESISPDPVKVLFASEDLKSEMVLNELNIYQKAFVVDVTVETVNGKPVAYRVTKLHETMDLAG